MRLFAGIDEFGAAVGTHLGWSRWHVVTQEQVNLFAEATGDHQWIHVDVERARSGPFGSTIAHGYLTMSLIPLLVAEVYDIDGLAMGVNYGANRLRFPAPVPTGSRVRAGVELLSVDALGDHFQSVDRVTIECDASDKPACVAEIVSVLVPASP